MWPERQGINVAHKHPALKSPLPALGNQDQVGNAVERVLVPECGGPSLVLATRHFATLDVYSGLWRN